MCGLAGIASPSAPAQALEQTAQRMVRALAHRGPDAQAVRPYDHLALGHARLSIIDPTADSNQPMVSTCGRYHIIYNGEIYNYLELREECGRLGYNFASAGDTEAILACVATMGIDKALPRLRGMFAFVLYDTIAGTLTIARDRFGQKPLYYTHSKDKGFAFASEIKALLESGTADKTALRDETIIEYFYLGGNARTHTPYRDIHELPAGHYATYDINTAALSIAPYAPDNASALTRNSTLTFEKAVEQLDELLTESVRLHLRSDVGAALFLSGGIDSGLIAAIAAKIGYPLHTFTIGTGNPYYDESSAAATIARHANLSHQIIHIDENIPRDAAAIFAAYDEPIADPSIIPTYYVTQAGAKYSKVFLTGDGGDEIFLGYRRYRAAQMRDRMGFMDSAALRPLYSLAARLIPSSDIAHGKLALAKRMLAGLAQSKKEQLLNYFIQGATPDDMQAMIDPAHAAQARAIYDGLFPVDMTRGFLDLTQLLDLDYQLPDTLLVKMDMAAMHHSIETRAPFLDNDLADFALSLPAHFHLGGGRSKHLLRTLAERYLPEAAVNMPKKGFEIPIHDLLTGALAADARAAILDQDGSILHRLFSRRGLENLLANQAGIPPVTWARKVWLFYAFAMWEKTRP